MPTSYVIKTTFCILPVLEYTCHMNKSRSSPKRVPMGIFKSPSDAYHVHKISSSDLSENAHYHNYYQIGYVEYGVITHCQEGKKVNLVGGDAFIIPPRFVHKVIFNENSVLYSLSFLPKIFNTSDSSSNFYKFLQALNIDAHKGVKLDVRLHITLEETHRKSIKSIFDCLLREFSSDAPQEMTASAPLIASLLSLLSQAYAVVPSTELRVRQYKTYRENVLRCIQYIEKNFYEPITIETLTNQFSISRSTLGLLFPRITGMTFKSYISQKRIEHASFMLRLSSHTITEISEMVGYEDFSTFFRNFTKIMGISPTEYRRQLEHQVDGSLVTDSDTDFPIQPATPTS